MSIFGKIMDRIFNRGEAAQAQPQQQAPSSQQTQSQSQVQPGQVTASAPQAGLQQGGQARNVDIEAVLNELAQQNGQRLNWRTSIVDLMKLVGMESSLQERKELADELGYKGDKSDSASMNIWLHKQVMAKLAQNGGKVPAELMD